MNSKTEKRKSDIKKYLEGINEYFNSKNYLRNKEKLRTLTSIDNIEEFIGSIVDIRFDLNLREFIKFSLVGVRNLYEEANLRIFRRLILDYLVLQVTNEKYKSINELELIYDILKFESIIYSRFEFILNSNLNEYAKYSLIKAYLILMFNDLHNELENEKKENEFILTNFERKYNSIKVDNEELIKLNDDDEKSNDFGFNNDSNELDDKSNDCNKQTNNYSRKLLEILGIDINELEEDYNDSSLDEEYYIQPQAFLAGFNYFQVEEDQNKNLCDSSRDYIEENVNQMNDIYVDEIRRLFGDSILEKITSNFTLYELFLLVKSSDFNNENYSTIVDKINKNSNKVKNDLKVISEHLNTIKTMAKRYGIVYF